MRHALLGGWARWPHVFALFALLFVVGTCRVWIWPPYQDRDKSDWVSEGYVIGGIKHYKVTGRLFADPLGRYVLAQEPYPLQHLQKQYDDFAGTTRPDGEWQAYKGRAGLGGIVFRVLCGAEMAFRGDCKLSRLRGINLLGVVAAISFVAAAFLPRFGLVFAVPFALVAFWSAGVTLFAENLYWAIWIYLVPALPWAIALASRDDSFGFVKWGMAWHAATMLFFFLIGFEFATMAVCAALALLAMNLLCRGASLRQVALHVTVFFAITAVAFVAVFAAAHDLKDMLTRIVLNVHGTKPGFPVENGQFALYFDIFVLVFARLSYPLLAVAYLAAMGCLFAAARRPGEASAAATAASMGFLVGLAGPVLWVLAMPRHSYVHFYIMVFSIGLFAIPFAAGFLAWLVADGWRRFARGPTYRGVGDVRPN